MEPTSGDARTFWDDHTPLFWDEAESDLFWVLSYAGSEVPPVIVAPPIVPLPPGMHGVSLAVSGVYRA